MHNRSFIISVSSLVIGILVSSCSGQTVPQFDARQAYNYLLKQCEFGPRPPGSTAHQKTRQFLVDELSKFADKVRLQPFPFTNYQTKQQLILHNIIASFGKQKKRILLAAHWDTRPWADMDPDPQNHNKPIIGANDGASGVAVLLEIARLLKSHPCPNGIDIVLFDGEDSGRADHPEEFSQGAKYFAKNKTFSYNPKFGILLDMIGDSDLQIYIEQYSQHYAPQIVKQVWEIAEGLGVPEFIPELGHAVIDDHLPLLEVGIPCIDIIDFDYPYWHTLEDTPDKCSPESLEKVGQVVVEVIYRR